MQKIPVCYGFVSVEFTNILQGYLTDTSANETSKRVGANTCREPT